MSASIFSFWGWDSALTVNEESKDAEKTPGRAALLCVVSILLTYLLVSISALMYAGDGTEGLGLGNEEISDNVFGALAEPVMGTPWNNLLFLAVLASSAASLMTTFLPTTRTMLGMATYGALPKSFARIHPTFKTPGLRHGRRRHHRRDCSTAILDLRLRGRADRHHPVARPDDLLLLRADRDRLCLVLPP